MKSGVKAVNDRDLDRGEAMLTAQAHILDMLFHSLVNRARLNMGEYLKAAESYMRLALRAQSQCRSTWEAISEIQNPQIARYVKQANVAHGHQQVNNASRTEKKENRPSKLLEDKEHEPDQWMDRGAPQEAVRVDQTLETVAKKHRPKDS